MIQYSCLSLFKCVFHICREFFHRPVLTHGDVRSSGPQLKAPPLRNYRESEKSGLLLGTSFREKFGVEGLILGERPPGCRTPR